MDKQERRKVEEEETMSRGGNTSLLVKCTVINVLIGIR